MGVLSSEQLLFAFCAGLKVRKFPTTAIKTEKYFTICLFSLQKWKKMFSDALVRIVYVGGAGGSKQLKQSWTSTLLQTAPIRFCSWHGVLWAPCLLFILAVYEPHWLTSEWIYISLFRNVQKSFDEGGRGNKYQRTSGGIGWQCWMHALLLPLP